MTDGRFTGSSSILFWQGQLVLEIRKKHKWEPKEDGSTLIGVGGIGGTMEEGETPVDALQREAIEEIGCRLKLSCARRTVVETPPTTRVEPDLVLDGLRPAIVWVVTDPMYDVGSQVAVFLAEAMQEPQPGDLPGLLLMSPEIFAQMSVERPLPVAVAIERGIEVRSKIPLPDNAVFLPANTMRRLLALRTSHEALFNEFLGLA